MVPPTPRWIPACPPSSPASLSLPPSTELRGPNAYSSSSSSSPHTPPSLLLFLLLFLLSLSPRLPPPSLNLFLFLLYLSPYSSSFPPPSLLLFLLLPLSLPAFLLLTGNLQSKYKVSLFLARALSLSFSGDLQHVQHDHDQRRVRGCNLQVGESLICLWIESERARERGGFIDCL